METVNLDGLAPRMKLRVARLTTENSGQYLDIHYQIHQNEKSLGDGTIIHHAVFMRLARFVTSEAAHNKLREFDKLVLENLCVKPFFLIDLEVQ